MTTQCFSTANSITEVLLAGDALLNLTDQVLNTTSGTRFVFVRGDGLACGKIPASVIWEPSLADSLPGLLSPDVVRLVVVSEENSPVAEDLTGELRTRGIPHVHCTLVPVCDASMFMDEEDSEAVTERLKQLGYL